MVKIQNGGKFDMKSNLKLEETYANAEGFRWGNMCILFHSSYLLIRAINLENHHGVSFQLCSIPLFTYLKYFWQYIYLRYMTFYICTFKFLSSF